MEIDVEENVSELNYSELVLRREAMRREKKFVSHKVSYWSNLLKSILRYESKLNDYFERLKHHCEDCKRAPSDNKMMKTLPDGRRVCTTCYNRITEEKFIENWNNQKLIKPPKTNKPNAYDCGGIDKQTQSCHKWNQIKGCTLNCKEINDPKCIRSH